MRILFILLTFSTLFGSVSAQRRDYMTEAEVEIVRNNQDVDLRIAVLTRMIDRRFAALGIESGGHKVKKSNDEWGEEPKGTRLELLSDIKKLLEKAIDDIDNLAARMPEKTKEEKKGENVFNKSVRSLAASSNRWIPLLRKEYDSTQDETIRVVTAGSIDFCEQIIDATSRLK